MKKIAFLAIVSALALSTGSLFAGFGTFGSGVVLDINGSITLYEISLAGDSRLVPLGSSPTINSTSQSAFANGTKTLGTFDTVYGTPTFNLAGADLLTYKNSGDNVDATYISFRIDGGAITNMSLAFNEDNVASTSGDQRWYSQTGGNIGHEVNLLTGLADGTHTLEFWFSDHSDTANSTSYDSNDGLNYKATFTVVPEPSTLALILGGALVGGICRRRR